MRGIPAHENALVKRITERPLKQTDPRGEGERASGPEEEEEGPRPTPSLARGRHTDSSPEVKTTECGAPPDFKADRPTPG